MGIIKSEREIAAMRQAGRVVATAPGVLSKQLGPGMKTREPMVNVGDWHTRVGKDHWVVLTADVGISAHI